MVLSHWRKWLSRSLPAARTHTSSRRFRPQLETLEDRCVPTQVVTTTVDNVPGSLRFAIANAQTTDTILFDPSLINQAIVLQSDLSNGVTPITKNLAFVAPGTIVNGAPSNLVGINGNGHQVFAFSGNVTVSITGLSIFNAHTSNLLAFPFNVAGPAISNRGGNLTLQNTLITNNVGSGVTGTCGAVSNGSYFSGTFIASTLTVTNCVFTGNKANGVGDGGAMFNDPLSTATISGCIFDSNSGNTNQFGGAIENDGNMQIFGSVLTNNSGLDTTVGGAIFNRPVLFGVTPTLTIQDSIITGNGVNNPNGAFASGSTGGGIANNSGNLLIINSTIANNFVLGGYSNNGGGIWTYAGKVTILNSTISGNQALSTAGGYSTGGGIDTYGVGSSLTLLDCTIASNRSGLGGGIANGVSFFPSPSTLTMYNNIVALNGSLAGGDISGPVDVAFNNFVSDGRNVTSAIFSPPPPHNLVFTARPQLVDGSNGNRVGVGPSASEASDPAGADFGQPANPNYKDPLLGSLVNNGGPSIVNSPTLTMALLPGSPAIGAGTPNIPLSLFVSAGVPSNLYFSPDGVTAYLRFDQRGFPRPGATPAIGAYQTQPLPIFAVGTDPGAGPEVIIFNGFDNSTSFDFNAYDAAFRGGVRTAVGDVNGDGVNDLVTGPGPGGGPLVEVFNGVDGSLLIAFDAYDQAFQGGVNVAVADVNGDGFADVIVGAGQGGGPLVKIFSGRALTLGLFTVPDDALLVAFNAYNALFGGGVNVAAGDTNGDGFAEIITGPGVGGGTLVKVFNGQTLVRGKFAVPDDALIIAYNAYDTLFGGGVFVAYGNSLVPGFGVVITGPGIKGGTLVKVFDGTSANLLLAFDATVSVAFPTQSNGITDAPLASPDNGTRVSTMAYLDPAAFGDLFVYSKISSLQTGFPTLEELLSPTYSPPTTIVPGQQSSASNNPVAVVQVQATAQQGK